MPLLSGFSRALWFVLPVVMSCFAETERRGLYVGFVTLVLTRRTRSIFDVSKDFDLSTHVDGARFPHCVSDDDDVYSYYVA